MRMRFGDVAVDPADVVAVAEKGDDSTMLVRVPAANDRAYNTCVIPIDRYGANKLLEYFEKESAAK